MNIRLIRALAVLAVLAVVGVFVWKAWAPRARDADVLSGYVEGDDLFLSAPVAGTVGRVYVVKGQRVAAGAPVFAMDQAQLSAQHAQADARLEQARAQIGAAEAQAQQAAASLASARTLEANARRDLDRYLALQKANPLAVSGQQLDQARTNAANAAAQRQGAEKAAAAAQVQAAAARAAAGQASAGVDEAGVKLGQLAQRAPAAGRIEDVFFQTGEWSGANQPVVALLPDGQVKLRFFAPEAQVQAYRPGRIVHFACDACAAGRTATVTYVSPRPEFTPPVIYSRNSRDKLVFLVEALPAGGAELVPGLPVEVQPLLPLRRRP
jgi:HlyD family secretion protein